jgi:hypothetical protein
MNVSIIIYPTTMPALPAYMFPAACAERMRSQKGAAFAARLLIVHDTDLFLRDHMQLDYISSGVNSGVFGCKNVELYVTAKILPSGKVRAE